MMNFRRGELVVEREGMINILGLCGEGGREREEGKETTVGGREG